MQNSLGFTERWLALGIVTNEEPQRWETLFATGEDPNTEHYRYRAFVLYLHGDRFRPDSETMQALYALAEADHGAAQAMKFAVLEHSACPRTLLRHAAQNEEGSIARLARQRLEKAW